MAFIRQETVRKQQRQNQWWGDGGGGVHIFLGSPRKYVLQSASQYDVTTRVSDFQNGEQSVHRRDGKKISISSRKHCFNFLDLEI